MKRFVLTYNAIEGFHKYPNAPAFCDYLASIHRHVFVIRCTFEVSHNEREIEINQMQLKIDEYLKSKYGYPCKFDNLSCESIAEDIMTTFNASTVSVLEDNYGGATLII